MNETKLSTIISKPIKDAVTVFCKKNGLKLKNFIEEALLERLEEQMDIEDIKSRKKEPTVSFEQIFKRMK